MYAKTLVKVDFSIQGMVNSTGNDYIIGILEEMGAWQRDHETGEPLVKRFLYTYYTYDPNNVEVSLQKPPIIFNEYNVDAATYNTLYAAVEPDVPEGMSQNKKEELMAYMGLSINMQSTFGISANDIEIVG